MPNKFHRFIANHVENFPADEATHPPNRHYVGDIELKRPTTMADIDVKLGKDVNLPNQTGKIDPRLRGAAARAKRKK